MNTTDAEPNRRILVIDDNPSIHADFRKILTENSPELDDMAKAEAELFGENAPQTASRQGFSLQSAYQGLEGIQAVREAAAKGAPMALAFVDVRMPPGLDGIETTARLWEIDPDLQVVICTAYSDYSWNEMFEKLGHSDRLVILKKPFDTVEVLQLASALTEKWHLVQETKKRMDVLERLVQERTAHLKTANEKLEAEVASRIHREECLSLQNDVTGILTNPTAGPTELIQSILQLVCERLAWSQGRFWSVDEQANQLRCAVRIESKGLPISTPQTSEEVPGRMVEDAWKSREPVWVSNGPGGPGENGEPGLANSSGFTLPLRLEGKVTGVLEFRSQVPHERDDALLEVFGPIGSLVGHCLERKHLEEQLRHSQKMDAIGHLAGGVAHDFNNILTVIQGYAQLLKNKPGLDPSAMEGLTQIAMAADRAASLTRQLLTFSRKQIMQTRSLDFNKVIGQLEKMLRRIIGEDIELKVASCPEPVVIQGDEGMLTQVIMNLACNARDAMPRGGRLSLSTETVVLEEQSTRLSAEARPGEFVCLKVRDTGTGIRTEDLPHIFEPFYTTKDVGRGTGLGLCTVYGIVKQHQGWIEVDSQIGSGSCFTIYLPRVSAAPQTAEASKPEHRLPRGSETILLVEDEAPVRGLARRFLEHLGYRVLEARSGLEALCVWERESHSVNLLLTDMVMPEGLSGRDLAHRIRGSKPDIRVLFASGYDPRAGEDSHDLTEKNFLQKPYTLQKLAHMVRQSLDSPVPEACGRALANA
jgi:signal transduction histidine kinase/DNA-binding response OmpR family regulator